MTDYPDEILRGISNNNRDFITEEGYVTQAAFRFDEYNTERCDGFCELSINWVDDEGAVDVLLRQINPKKGVPQFQGGYCRFARKMLRAALNAYFRNGHLSYERSPLSENKYHGNILIKNDVSKPIKTNVQATLAALAGIAVPRSDLDS